MRDALGAINDRVARLIRHHIEPAVYCARIPARVSTWEACADDAGFPEARQASYAPIQPGAAWGPPWRTTWFRIQADQPEHWQNLLADGDRFRLELLVDLGFTRSRSGFQCEGLVYRDDGQPWKALSPLNHHLPIENASAGIEVLVEAASNPDFQIETFEFTPTLLGDRATAGIAPQYVFGGADLAVFDATVWELLQDFRALRGLAEELPASSTVRAEVLFALERACNAVDPDDISHSAAAARRELDGVRTKPPAASAHSIVAVGHAHIDSAWLWPVHETVRKCARTFSNVLHLMDEHPRFVFAASSAQQYLWVKNAYPGLYERIRKRVAEGRFVPVGGMWVESDTNMPGGEALARQLIEGKTFFIEEFGIDTPEVWLPDSFGYSAALPQLATAAGARWFLTQKLSWNQTNRMPHHTFLWEGIDGTRVFTHFPPVDTYGSDLSARDLLHAQENFSERGRAGTSLVPYGWGDGGGGPTREMLASGERFAGLEGAPRVAFGSPTAFFMAAEAELQQPKVWSGELYLESHRGTLTSQLRTKQGNRRNEHRLREAEYWSAARTLLTGAPYPAEVLQEAWRVLLLHQFHDILPGSAIAWVHREAEAAYADLTRRLDALIAEATSDLVGEGSLDLRVNSSPFARRGIAGMSIGEHAPRNGSVEVVESVDRITVRTDHLLMVVDGSGRILHLVDGVSGRDAFGNGRMGNLLVIHRDIPDRWDAWDLDEHYRHNSTRLKASEPIDVDRSPGRVRLIIRYETAHSHIEQRLTIDADSPGVRIENVVNWRERQKLLKLGFELDLAAERSTSETQFGHVHRPTHVNTSWEAAKFEFCAQRWIHVGEPRYGVAVSNDSTYGHDVARAVGPDGHPSTIVRLSMIRSPIYPDPKSDQGEHVMNILIRPGATISDAIQDGYAVNLPERRIIGGSIVAPLVTSTARAAVIECVKLARDGSGDLIVRLYEAEGSRIETRMCVSVPTRSVVRTDLLERPTGAPLLRDKDQTVSLRLRPFEIITLRFVVDR